MIACLPLQDAVSKTRSATCQCRYIYSRIDAVTTFCHSPKSFKVINNKLVFAILALDANVVGAFQPIDKLVDVEVLLLCKNPFNGITFGIDEDCSRKPSAVGPLLEENVRVCARLNHFFHAILVNPVFCAVQVPQLFANLDATLAIVYVD